MRVWHVVVIDAFLVGANVFAGVANVVRHHTFTAVFSFGAAAFITFLATRHLRNLRRYNMIARDLHELRSELRADPTEAGALKARAILVRVAHAVGARPSPRKGNGWELVVEGKVFDVVPGGVYNASDNTSTCYTTQPMPYEEQVASALLFLKSDPNVYWRWMREAGRG